MGKKRMVEHFTNCESFLGLKLQNAFNEVFGLLRNGIFREFIYPRFYFSVGCFDIFGFKWRLSK